MVEFFGEAVGSLPEAEEYQLVVDASEIALINKVQNATRKITNRKAKVSRAGELKGCLLGTHLDEPVRHSAKRPEDFRLRSGRRCQSYRAQERTPCPRSFRPSRGTG